MGGGHPNLLLSKFLLLCYFCIVFTRIGARRGKKLAFCVISEVNDSINTWFVSQDAEYFLNGLDNKSRSLAHVALPCPDFHKV